MTWCHGKYNDDPRTSLKLYLGSPEAASLMNSNTEGGDSSGRKLEREESISEMVQCTLENLTIKIPVKFWSF